MKLIKIHAKIKKKQEKLMISHQKHENHEIPTIPRQNHKQNEN